LTCTIAALAVVATWYAEQPPVSEKLPVTEIQAVIAARKQAVDELLAGKATLPETAHRFRALTLTDPIDITRALEQLYPSYSEDELHYMHVLMYVEAACKMRADGNERLNSLREEFEQRRQTGTLNATHARP
jgi:hypothetical protein